MFVYALKDKGVPHRLLYEGATKSEDEDLPIFFAHGVLPIKGGYSSRVVLAEMDYQQESASPYAWGNQVQLQHFATRTCIFIGNSMTDPNVRRLLRLSRSTSACPHFCFLPSSNHSDDRLFESLFDYDLSRIGVLPIRFPKGESRDPYARLPQLLDILCEAAINPKAIWS